MIILGIDPGLAVTGYGVIDAREDAVECIDYGAIRTKETEKKENRLFLIFSLLDGIIEKHKPEVMAVELLFFNRNTKTALTVGEARGVVLLCAGKNRVPVCDYTPLQVKECLTGYGRAKKNEVREIVQIELEMDKPPRPIDASDALAIALCHCFLGDEEQV